MSTQVFDFAVQAAMLALEAFAVYLVWSDQRRGR